MRRLVVLVVVAACLLCCSMTVEAKRKSKADIDSSKSEFKEEPKKWCMDYSKRIDMEVYEYEYRIAKDKSKEEALSYLDRAISMTDNPPDECRKHGGWMRTLLLQNQNLRRDREKLMTDIEKERGSRPAPSGLEMNKGKDGVITIKQKK